MLNSIFISVPLNAEWNTVVVFSKKLESKGFKVNVWDRKSKYAQDSFDKSDAVLFILPSNKFSASGSDLPVGLKRELSAAYNQRKKIFVGYKNSVGEFSIYNGETNGISIVGIQGTRNNILGCNTYKVSRRALARFPEKAAYNIALNSFYGTLDPCATIPLNSEVPGLRGPIGNPGIPGLYGIDYDERLLLM